MADVQRPPHPYDPPPDGYEWVAAVDGSWRIARPDKGCRALLGAPRRKCAGAAVAELNRGRVAGGKLREAWWTYCPDHLYGRWVEDGRVLGWVLREVPISPERRAEILRAVARG